MAGGYSAIFKAEVLDYADDTGLGVAQVCRDKDVSRDSFYRWREDSEEIRRQAQEERSRLRKTEAERREAEQTIQNVIKDFDSIDLAQIGDRKLRKTRMGEQVERLLFGVLGILKDYDKLADLHPKDLGQLAERLHKIKQQLYEEPQYVIEVRNRYIRDSLTVLKELEVPQGTVQAFAEQMQKIEEAEVVG